MRVSFVVIINGRGETIDQCWEDAVERFASDPGLAREPIIEEEDEEELGNETY